MIYCNQQLAKEGKPYPRTCHECGIGPCTQQEDAQADALEKIRAYSAAPGWTNRQQIVNQVLQDADGPENAVHRLLAAAATLLSASD